MQTPYVIKRRASREEYGDLMPFLDRAFGFDKEAGFESLLPKLYRPGHDPCPKNRIITENGIISAAVGEYDSLLSVGGTLLKCRGIGNVATNPDCRGKGYMTELMNDSVAEMCRSDVDLSVLGGKCERYARFGYESLGPEYSLLITEASLCRAAVRDDNSIDFTAVKADDESLIGQIYSLHLTRPLRTVRDRKSFFDICSSWRIPTIAVTKSGKLVGYFIGDLAELTLTDCSLFGAVVRKYVREHGDVTLRLPAWDRRIITLASRAAESIEYGTSYMFNIFNYERVLGAFFSFASSLSPLSDFSLTALIHGQRCDEQLTAAVSDGYASVTQSGGAPDIELGHAEAMRFFFGTDSPERDGFLPAVSSVLPLPIYIERADHI